MRVNLFTEEEIAVAKAAGMEISPPSLYFDKEVVGALASIEVPLENWGLQAGLQAGYSRLEAVMEVADRFLKQKATYSELRQAVKAAKIDDQRQVLSNLLSILPQSGMDEGSGE